MHTNTIPLLETYRTRSIRPLGLWLSEGWRLKAYGIAYDAPDPRAELVEAVKRTALKILPQPPAADGRYGVGFLGAHDGRGGCFAFVDWWSNENELHHHAFTATWDAPANLRPVPDEGPIGCAWDLAVIAFERQAWVDSVLANPFGPDLEAYLDSHITAVV
jgi:hypothetical protein